MLLNGQQIRSMTKGAARIEEENGWYKFLRFTKQEEDAYASHPNKAKQSTFFSSTFKPAGVRFALRTNSDYIAFDVSCGTPCVAPCKLDIYENGAMTRQIVVPYAYIPEAHVQIPLSAEEKLLEIYFPYNARAEIANVELADGATFEPASRRYKMIAYGDSITHGSNADLPSFPYAVAVARLLNADVTNKGIGGEQFFPNLISEPAPEPPDWITVAYGTNDWRHRTAEKFEENCKEFFKRLAALYPSTPIFAITPTWRADFEIETPYGAPVTAIEPVIRRLVAEYPNVTVISGWNLVPHKNIEFFADQRLHPNDLGFGVYTSNLYRALLPYLIEKIGYSFD